MSNIVRSQLSEHSAYGGVVPEIAARAHVEVLDQIVELALREASIELQDCNAIAVTAGPGLISGLMTGLMTAKALALVKNLPLIAVNHLEGHALTVGLTDGVAFPYLLLLVSGGHTQLLIVKDVGCYVQLGTTVDDALGEAFDKTAKLLGLGFPGGPEVERCAKKGNPGRFDLPRPMLGREDPNFSFSGLKTALRHNAQRIAPLSDQDIADLCASFESAVVQTVSDRVRKAMIIYEQQLGGSAPKQFVIAGGVGANQKLREALGQVAEDAGFSVYIPPADLCTDNGAMIAWAGAERFVRGWCDPLDVSARARWPLDASAPPALGAGAKA